MNEPAKFIDVMVKILFTQGVSKGWEIADYLAAAPHPLDTPHYSNSIHKL
jgi:hypothetical protein